MMLLDPFLDWFEPERQVDILFASALAGGDHRIFGDYGPLAGVHLEVFQRGLGTRHGCLAVSEWLSEG